MNQILEWLSGGDLRSDGLAGEAAQIVLKNPQLFSDLYAGLSQSEDVIRGRAADALEKVSRQRPDLLVDHLGQLADLASRDPLPMVKMHLAMIFGHLAVYEQHIDTLRAALLDLLEEPGVFARSWAIVSLCIIGRKYPQERARIVSCISQLQGDSSVAIRSKVRNALNILTDDNYPFPKGWIKSEQLQGI